MFEGGGSGLKGGRDTHTPLRKGVIFSWTLMAPQAILLISGAFFDKELSQKEMLDRWVSSTSYENLCCNKSEGNQKLLNETNVRTLQGLAGPSMPSCPWTLLAAPRSDYSKSFKASNPQSLSLKMARPTCPSLQLILGREVRSPGDR